MYFQVGLVPILRYLSYCGPECQKEDWVSHKRGCAALKLDAERTAKIIADGGFRQHNECVDTSTTS